MCFVVLVKVIPFTALEWNQRSNLGLLTRGGNVPSPSPSMNKQPNKNKQTNRPAKLTKAQKAQVRQIQATGGKSNRGGILSKVGELAGSIVGLPGIGKFLGSGIAAVLGRGDYTVAGPGIKSNSLVTGTTPPAFGNERSDRATIISHREYLTDITTGPTLVNGATSFDYRRYFINPGVKMSFPWLAQVAQNFEEYEMLGCLFEFKSTSGASLSSTNTALGTVIMSTQYNTLNDAFESKLTQENYEFAQSLKPAESGLHAVECARNQNVLPRLYIRTGNVPDDGDQRLYDLGQFQISTVGMQATNVVIGELWITYHIALYKPKVPQTIDAPVLSSRLFSATGTATYPMGNVDLSSSPGSTMNMTMKFNSTTNETILYFPPEITSGYFLAVFRVTMAAGTTNSAPTLSAVNKCIVNHILHTPSCNSRYLFSVAAVNVIGGAASMKLAGAVGLTLEYPTMLITQWAVSAPARKDIVSDQEKRLMLAYAKKLARLRNDRDLDLNLLFEENENEMEEERGTIILEERKDEEEIPLGPKKKPKK